MAAYPTYDSDYIEGSDEADSINALGGDDVVLGNAGNDTLLGGAGYDYMVGDAGDDLLNGGSDGDYLQGFTGSDTVLGGGGDDHIVGGSADTADLHNGGEGDDTIDGGAGDILIGGRGTDRFYLTLSLVTEDLALDLSDFANSGRLTLNDGTTVKGFEFGAIYLGSGDDRVAIGDAPIAVLGQGGDDTITGGALADFISGDSGDDKLDGGSGADTVGFYAPNGVNVSLAITTAQDTGAGLDTLINFENLWGSYYSDTLIGNRDANVLHGREGSDTLNGGAGDDVLHGSTDFIFDQDGQDVLYGGRGHDELWGYGGEDTFVFRSVSESTNKRPDLIVWLQMTDTIDLSAIDADEGSAGDQAFHVVTGAFTGEAGEIRLRYIKSSEHTLLLMDVDGDGKSDSKIDLGAGDYTEFSSFAL